MEPYGRNNSPANKWTFDGGLNNDNKNDGINNNQQENKKMAAISPSQKLDGEIPMGNWYRGATRNTLEVGPGLDETRAPGVYSGFKTALEKSREKIMDPAPSPSTANSVGKRLRSKTTWKNGGNSGTKWSNYNTSGRLPS
jgi:hypothetical protein